jgi:lysophospholipase L1-like esterase
MKKAPDAHKKQTPDTKTQEAIKIGCEQAKRVLDFRAKELQKRERALKKHMRKVGPRGVAPAAPKLFKAVGQPGSAGLLIAEGDSWFNYPGGDILDLLKNHYAYNVESVAYMGDQIEDMAYSDGQLNRFTQCIENSLRRNEIPKAVLLSGGGNDIAGKEFGFLLNHALSSNAGLNWKVIQGVIDDRIYYAYVTIISAVTNTCLDYIKPPIPILIHGYDYPVPDGRGLGGGFFSKGPWLEPGFREKGYNDLEKRKKFAMDLIDYFNKMLKRIVALMGFEHVKYVELLGTLSTGPYYKKDWANELHPTCSGFKKVTDRFAAVLALL